MTRHITTLDAMRGAAALAILALHICKLFDLPYQLPNAHLAVDFFFILSGFVIANAYERRLQSGWRLRSFARKRLVRLYPLVLAGGALGLLVLAARQAMYHDLGWTAVVLAAAPNLLLAPTPALQSFRPFSFPLNSPYWSLSAEVLVNFAYAAVARRLGDRQLAIAILVSSAGLAAVALTKGTLDLGLYWSDYDLGLVRAVAPFLIGVALYRLHPRLPQAGDWGQIAVPALAVLLLTPIRLPGGVQLAMAAAGFPLMLAVGLSAKLPAWLAPFWRALGELSYPLYAVHYPIVIVFSQIAKSLRLTGPSELWLAAACAAGAVTVSWLTLILFDRPVRRGLEARLGRKVVEKNAVAA